MSLVQDCLQCETWLPRENHVIYMLLWEGLCMGSLPISSWSYWFNAQWTNFQLLTPAILCLQAFPGSLRWLCLCQGNLHEMKLNRQIIQVCCIRGERLNSTGTAGDLQSMSRVREPVGGKLLKGMQVSRVGKESFISYQSGGGIPLNRLSTILATTGLSIPRTSPS